MIGWQRWLRLLAALLGAVSLVIVVPARAADTWTSGACSDDQGVTVVVDHAALGGGTVVRCVERWAATIAATGRRGTGMDALSLAGLPVTMPQRAPGAVCRINGRPSASEAIPVHGNTGYRESCVQMPPAKAYWSYWNASAGGSWRYATSGAGRTIQAGAFEGWSFQLNSSSEKDAAPPRAAPVRGAPRVPAPNTSAPVPAPGRTTAPPAPRPGNRATTAPTHRTTSATTTTTTGVPTASSTATSAEPTPSPTSAVSSEPAPTPSPTSEASAVPLPGDTGAPVEPSATPATGSGRGTAIGIGIVAAVAAAAGGVLLWRRRRG